MFHRVPPTRSRIIIAELKRNGPDGTVLTTDTFEERLKLCIRVGDVISIHDHEIWRGSCLDITRARLLTHKPILAKGLHGTVEEIESALRAGADYVLVVGWMPPEHLLPFCFIEVLTLGELARVPKEAAAAVWNGRDLSIVRAKAGVPKHLLKRWRHLPKLAPGELGVERPRPSFKKARLVLPRPRRLIQASKARTIGDFEPEADGIIVGTHLVTFAQSQGIVD